MWTGRADLRGLLDSEEDELSDAKCKVGDVVLIENGYDLIERTVVEVVKGCAGGTTNFFYLLNKKPHWRDRSKWVSDYPIKAVVVPR